MTVVSSEDVVFAALPGRRSGDPLRGVEAASSLRLSHPERTNSRRAHRHPNSEEVIYVRTGTGVVYIDGTIHRVTPGTWSMCLAGLPTPLRPMRGPPWNSSASFLIPNLAENIEETDIDIMKEIQGD